MSIIQCTNLFFAYEGNLVIKDLSFQVEGGDYLCVVGENGSGKSTLIKGILGLKKPVSGYVLIDKNLGKGEIGYLPQQNESLRDFPASVQEVILSGCMNRRGLRPYYSQRDRERAEHWIDRLSLTSIKNKSFQELSGGQRQRVFLARALCASEKLIVLDEPTAGLDPVITREMYQLVGEINRDLGITVVMISHDIREAVNVASHILHLDREGSFFGRVEDYVGNRLGKYYMGQED